MSKAMSASSLPCVTPHMKPAVSALSVYSSLPRKPASSHIHNRTLEPSSVSCASPSSSTSRPAHRGVPFQAKFTTPPSVLQGTSKLKTRSSFSPTVSLSSSLGRKTGAMAREVVSPSTSYIRQDSGSPLRRTLQHSKHANISRHSLDSIRWASSDSPVVSHLATKQEPNVTLSMTSSMMKTSSASRLPTKVPTITSSSSLSRLPRRVLSRVDRM